MKNNVEEMNIHAVDYPNKCRQKKTATEFRWMDYDFELFQACIQYKKAIKKILNDA